MIIFSALINGSPVPKLRFHRGNEHWKLETEYGAHSGNGKRLVIVSRLLLGIHLSITVFESLKSITYIHRFTWWFYIRDAYEEISIFLA